MYVGIIMKIMYTWRHSYKVRAYTYAGSSENFDSSKVVVLVEPGIASSLQVYIDVSMIFRKEYRIPLIICMVPLATSQYQNHYDNQSDAQNEDNSHYSTNDGCSVVSTCTVT